MVWGQNMGPTADETLKFDNKDHSEDLGVKGMSGGGVSSVIKAVGVKPGEVESLRRDRTVSVLTPSMVVTDRYQEKP
jgi:hypothetical protein